MSQNVTGQALDYETFKREYDSNPSLGDIVDNFDERAITLKTQPDQVEPMQANDGAAVDNMAKRAAEKAMNR